MTAVSQTLSNAFSWTKMLEFRWRFHWSLFLRVQFTIIQYWFRQWLGADQAISHYLTQWWLVYWRIYASLSLKELTFFLLPIARFPNYNLPSRSYEMASTLSFASGSVCGTRFQSHIAEMSTRRISTAGYTFGATPDAQIQIWFANNFALTRNIETNIN